MERLDDWNQSGGSVCSTLSESLDPEGAQHSQRTKVGTAHLSGTVFAFWSESVALALEGAIAEISTAEHHAIAEIADFVAEHLGNGHGSFGMLDFLGGRKRSINKGVFVPNRDDQTIQDVDRI